MKRQKGPLVMNIAYTYIIMGLLVGRRRV